jgi:glutamate-1-semialdehyde aminotransferase
MGTGQKLYEKAKKLIPGGTQLLSKRPEMFLPENWPAYYSKAKGCEVWDLDGNRYYDMSLMGVGANVLGYSFEPVDKAAVEAINSGGMCTLNAPEEVELAEILLRIHPWAGMVRYSKAGGEAMSMATRIARAHTKKDIVLVCGYHGWHDWYLAANLVKGDPLAGVHLQGLEPAGVPKDLAGSNLIFKYNDAERFMQLINENKNQIAAVIMEPIRSDYPQDNFLEKIREVTRNEKIVLIFDEISAGFRLCTGGSHLHFGIEPDIAVFAKGLTNGYPLSVVMGRENVMQSVQDTFMSSTFWTERVALAATVASVQFYEKNNVAAHLNEAGKKVQNGWARAAEKTGLQIHAGGIYPLSHFAFKHENPLALKTFFTQEMLSRGFLASTGFYASFSHTDEIIQKYLSACENVFEKISQTLSSGKNISSELNGPICHAGFERLN